MLRALRRFPSFLERRTWLQATALAIAFVAAWPLLQSNGLLNTRGGGDSPFLLQRLQQLVVALRDGHFPVRWMPDAAYGYGYPFYNYYAPLSIYIAALFRFLGFAYARAIQMAQLLGFLVAAWAVFELAARWFKSEWAGLLASAAYTLAPFHLVNVYVRGDSLAEFWAMALYPLSLLAVDHLLRCLRHTGPKRSHSAPLRRAAVLLGLSYAALVLCHNISALIFSPFLLLYVLLASWSQKESRLRSLLYSASGLTLGLLLAAWFWIPALAETDLVQTAAVTEGYFHFASHFWGTDLIQPSLIFDYDVARRGAFRMGMVQALLTVVGSVILIWQVRRRQPQSLLPARALFLLGALVIATLMITAASRPLWENLPLLPYVQFPWRFLSIQALAGALISGALALLPLRRFLVPAAAAILLLSALSGLSPDHLLLSDADVTSQRLAQYEWFTGNIGSTVSAEYLPVQVQPRPYTSPWLNSGQRDRAQVLEGQATVELTDRRAVHQSWQVVVHGPSALIEFPTFYWPGWQATINGERVSLSTAGNSGLLSLPVPQGRHTVVLYLARTPLRLTAELLSLLALLLAVGLLAWGATEQRRERSPVAGPNLAFAALLLLFMVAWRFWPQATFSPATATWDFAHMGYLHNAPQGIEYGDGWRLLRYRYNAHTVEAGETLRITVETAGNPTGSQADTAVTLQTPATHRFVTAPALQHSRQLSSGGSIVYELPIPSNAPPGLYVPQLMREGAQPLTPSGERRGDLFLRPIRVLPAARTGSDAEAALQVRAEEVSLSGEAPVLDPDAQGLFDCAGAGPSTSHLQLQLAWLTTAPLGDNYTVSLRLSGPAGLVFAQCDMQPGYGFQPSGLWPAGTWTFDRLALPLPSRLPQADYYVLLVMLYKEPGTLVFTRRLGELSWQEEGLAFRPAQPRFELPSDVDIEEVQARFGELAHLRGYRLSQSGDSLSLTLYWEAMRPASQNAIRFVHLLGPDLQQPVAQLDSMPRNNSYPTTQWSPGEIVADPVMLDLGAVPAGHYQLAVGFYPPAEPSARLPVFDEQGQPLPQNRFLLPALIEK